MSIAAFLTEDGIRKENMGYLLAGFDLPGPKPFKNHEDWAKYAKWYSVACQEYSPSDEELGVSVEDGEVEFKKGLMPFVQSVTTHLTIEQALALADKYKPELGYTMRMALRERADLYQPNEPKQVQKEEEAAVRKAQWSIKKYAREGDMIRRHLIRSLLQFDQTLPPPELSEVLDRVSDSIVPVPSRTGPKTYMCADEKTDSDNLRKRLRDLIVRN